MRAGDHPAGDVPAGVVQGAPRRRAELRGRGAVPGRRSATRTQRHPVAGPPFLGGQVRVAVLDLAVQDPGHTGAADALLAGAIRVDPRPVQGVEHRLVRPDRDGGAGAGEHDVEPGGARGHGRLGDEALVVDGPGGRPWRRAAACTASISPAGPHTWTRSSSPGRPSRSSRTAVVPAGSSPRWVRV
ncbi:hypothetical protein L7F22_069183 [Adiantum nelumboides]|nr:hypothetical protein [Adiantum nelumboides]